MKILVFNGSPKREKSDTMQITRAFLAGMEEAAPQEIQTFHVIDRHIAFCRGCFACKYNGGRCVIDDDMREILEQMLVSDLLLFSYPLYCCGMPAALKNLVDRTLPLSSMAMAEVNGSYVHVGQRDYSHLRYLMICGCGFPNSRRNFEPAIRQFRIPAYVSMRGSFLVGGTDGHRPNRMCTRQPCGAALIMADAARVLPSQYRRLLKSTVFQDHAS